jgi:hypothetical protein
LALVPTSHVLDERRSALVQALSQDKRPLAVLLGAGCPLAVDDPATPGTPLIPDIAGLTAAVASAASTTPHQAAHDRLVDLLAADLARPPTVEDMLSWLRSVNRIAGGDEVRGLSSTAVTDLELAIVEAITGAVHAPLPGGDTPYDALAVWTGAVRRTCPLHLFTTNYDLLVEQALERRSIPLFDGFVGAHEPFLDVGAMERDTIPARWSRLWKLHGSINWVAEGDRVVRRPVETGGAPRLVHPSHLKYDESRRMPYLAMQDQLRRFFTEPAATVVTVGFSFGDAHINEVLADGLNANPGTTIFALRFGPLAGYPGALALAGRTRNLLLFGQDEAVVGGIRGSWDDADGCDLGDFARFGQLLRTLASRADDSA